MREPIKAGDLAEVISGKNGTASPNIGLIVSVVSLQGEHSLYGRIWRCEAKYGEAGQPGIAVPPGHLDFAQDWLRKVSPPPLPDKARTKDLVLQDDEQ